MSMPADAQLSDDGQWWWDGENWQAVETSGGTGGGGTGGGGAPGAAAFDFDTNGLRIGSESAPVPTAGEALTAAFYVCNTGTADGQCRVTITIDGQDSGVTWDSPVIPAGQCAAPDGDGYVHGLPAQLAGSHTFEASATPAGPYGGKIPNTTDVAPAS
jgi:hypothetical protein